MTDQPRLASETASRPGAWAPDPLGRHSERYFVGSEPTSYVRDAGAVTVDKTGVQTEDAAIALPPPPPTIATMPTDRPETPTATSTTVSDSRPPARRRRSKIIILPVVAVLVVGVAIGLMQFVGGGDSKASTYLKQLDAKGLRSQFANDQTAVANAQRVCNSLTGGGVAEGYARDAVAVQVYCPSFFDKFKVIPTPEQQRAVYLTALRDQGLAGTFTSDENAVAHAQKICADLKNGGAQQGLAEDKVAVQVYCSAFLGGFKVLRTVTIKGDFTLMDSSPSYLYPSISSSSGSCYGSGGYNDIGPGTVVSVKNGAGKLLTQGTLGSGSGHSTICVLPFEVTVTEGEDQYVFEASHRGSLIYTFTQLNTNGIHITLGS